MLGTIVLFLLIGVTLETAKDAAQCGMARITLGSVLNSISGSIDQMVYSTWKGINYIRSKAKTISNPQSTAQMELRDRVAECAKYWNDTLTAPERAAWETYASSIVIPSSGPGDIIKPAKGPFSGYTAFLRNNILLFLTGSKALGAFLKQAPIGVTGPDAPTAVACSGGAANIGCSWTPGTIPGEFVLTWGRSQNANIHAQIINVTAVAAGISTTTTVAGKGGLSVLLSKMRGLFDVQVMAVDNQGQPSNASNLVRGVSITGI